MLKNPLSVDSKFYSEELDLKGKTKVRIFWVFFQPYSKVCLQSVSGRNERVDRTFEFRHDS